MLATSDLEADQKKGAKDFTIDNGVFQLICLFSIYCLTPLPQLALLLDMLFKEEQVKQLNK